jgi:hypothetical protein
VATKEARRRAQKNYEERHPDRVIASRKKCYHDAQADPIRKAKKLLQSRQWKQRNKKKVQAYRRKYWLENSEIEKMAARAWRVANPERVKEFQKQWQESEQCKVTQRKWKSANRDHCLEYIRERRKNDPSFAIGLRLRGLLRYHIRNRKTTKAGRTLDLLGCTLSEFLRYLESLFTDGMSWDRFGEIDIDHIRPCVSFDLTDPEQQKVCFHYTNLQPLWSSDNRKKSSMWNGKIVRKTRQPELEQQVA